MASARSSRAAWLAARRSVLPLHAMKTLTLADGLGSTTATRRLPADTRTFRSLPGCRRAAQNAAKERHTKRDGSWERSPSASIWDSCTSMYGANVDVGRKADRVGPCALGLSPLDGRCRGVLAPDKPPPPPSPLARKVEKKRCANAAMADLGVAMSEPGLEGRLCSDARRASAAEASAAAAASGRALALEGRCPAAGAAAMGVVWLQWSMKATRRSQLALKKRCIASALTEPLELSVLVQGAGTAPLCPHQLGFGRVAWVSPRATSGVRGAQSAQGEARRHLRVKDAALAGPWCICLRTVGLDMGLKFCTPPPCAWLAPCAPPPAKRRCPQSSVTEAPWLGAACRTTAATSYAAEENWGGRSRHEMGVCARASEEASTV